MRRINSANATPDGLFQDVNQSTGQRATFQTAQWHNDVQESLLAITGGVESPAYDAVLKAIVNIAHPVTSYLMLERAESPSVDWPWTEWVEVKGRMLVGFDDAQTEFNLVGKQAGAKSVNVAIPRDGWGATQSSGHLPSPSTSGRLVVGSGLNEVSEDLESLAHAANTPTAAVPQLPPYRVVKVWRRTA